MLKHLVLPAVSLGTIPMVIIARMTRSSMIEVLKEDYIKPRALRAAGLLGWFLSTRFATRLCP